VLEYAGGIQEECHDLRVLGLEFGLGVFWHNLPNALNRMQVRVHRELSIRVEAKNALCSFSCNDKRFFYWYISGMKHDAPPFVRRILQRGE
jgi:hypothetical protein